MLRKTNDDISAMCTFETISFRNCVIGFNRYIIIDIICDLFFFFLKSITIVFQINGFKNVFSMKHSSWLLVFNNVLLSIWMLICLRWASILKLLIITFILANCIVWSQIDTLDRCKISLQTKQDKTQKDFEAEENYLNMS